MDFIYKFIAEANGFVWTYVPYVLIITGIFFIILTKFVQVRYFKFAFKSLLSGKHTTSHDDVNITPLQSFMTGLASRVGMGNIAGVATAIVSGGEGAIFWMWLAALIGMASAFAESSLAQLYKTKNAEGLFVGGPAFYIAQGLKLPFLGVIFSILLAFTYAFAFNSIQANQIANTLNHAFNVPFTTSAIAMTIITAVVIFGSIKVISKFSGVIVVAMSIIYILVGLVVISINYDQIGTALYKIFHGAFSPEAALGGGLGVTIQYGIKRGLFSNEAGMGSAPNIAASASTKHPADQGFVQMIGVFFDTMIICTFTALVIITSQQYTLNGPLSGAALTTSSISSTLGSWSAIVVSIIVFLFAFSSIIGNFAYALSGLKYFTSNKYVRIVFTIATLVFIYLGSVTAPQIVWDFGDLFMGLMTFINCFAIVFLYKKVKLIIHDYSRQLAKGIEHPEFNSDLYPELRDSIFHRSIWSHNLDEDADSTKYREQPKAE